MAIPRRRRHPDEPSFQMTPMIDMTFLLLIFFMVTTKMSKEQVKLEVALPTASAAIQPEDLSNRDIVNIDHQAPSTWPTTRYRPGSSRPT
ncbi:ExbD/TolR family protein [Verrucomicrobium spinosum]|uniref:ExbD/TolR family protein n=1 Tax=Verrucomicrobium spinosum TaxID=2736 RepID=UPI0009EA7E44|nr:biopolymer transporter ExbD [Verrucomicrobium spinosum]